MSQHQGLKTALLAALALLIGVTVGIFLNSEPDQPAATPERVAVVDLAGDARTSHGSLTPSVTADDAPPVVATPSSALPTTASAPGAQVEPKSAAPVVVIADAPPAPPSSKRVQSPRAPWEIERSSATHDGGVAEVLPVIIEPSSPDPEPSRHPEVSQGRVTVVESALGLGVRDRQPHDVGTRFDLGDRQVTAWVKVSNSGPPSHVTMVWRKGEQEGWRIDLKVGTSTGWRTWSRKTIRSWDAGDWTVDVFDDDGVLIDQLTFVVDGDVDAEEAG